MSRSKIAIKAVLAGESLTPDQVIRDGALLIEGDRLARIERPVARLPADREVFDASS